jgi:hypothetical protein
MPGNFQFFIKSIEEENNDKVFVGRQYTKQKPIEGTLARDRLFH